MQVRGVAAFLKGKVTLSQSEGTHQFLSPEYHRFFTNKKNTKTKTKTILTKGGGEGGEHGHSRTPLAMPLRVISQYPIKFWRTFNRNPLISPTSRIECRHKSDKFMERCDEDFKSGLHFTKEDLWRLTKSISFLEFLSYHGNNNDISTNPVIELWIYKSWTKCCQEQSTSIIIAMRHWFLEENGRC